MSVSRGEKIARYMDSEDCYFIGDKKDKLYHAKNCRFVNVIVNSSLVACGPNPENQGFRPCPFCKPTPVELPPKEKKATRATNLKEQLEALAERRGMHLRFKGPNVFVETIAGEWYFDYTVPVITLHHRNYRYIQTGESKGSGDYHTQKEQFESPVVAMHYIYNHEREKERELFAPKAEQVSIRFLDDRKRRFGLFCGTRQILPGEEINVLLPTGWVPVTVAQNRDGAWCITTKEYAHISPIGLFASFD